MAGDQGPSLTQDRASYLWTPSRIHSKEAQDGSLSIRGNSVRPRKGPEESIAKDQLAIEADSQSRDAFYERAKGLEHQGKYQAAVEDGEKALTLPELGTSDSQIHFLLGNVYLRLNKPDLAAAHLAKFHAAPQTTQR